MILAISQGSVNCTIFARRMPSYATRTVSSSKKFTSFLVITTERYIGCKQNLEQPVNDWFNSVMPLGAQSE